MLWDLVNMFMGSLPEEFEFLKIFGVLFVLYIFIMIFNMLWQATLNILKGF